MLALIAQTIPKLNIGQAVGVPQTPDFGIGLFFGRLMTMALIIGVLLVFLYLLWGGLEWIASHQEKSKVEAARNKITGAVIGLIVLSSSVALMLLVQQLLDIKIIQFSGPNAATSTTTKTGSPLQNSLP